MSQTRPRSSSSRRARAIAPRAAAASGIPAEADRTLLARYAPASVVVDEGLDVLEFRGDTHPFLAHARGQASLNLMKRARKGLLPALRKAIQEARRTHAPFRKEGLRIRYRGQVRDVSLEVLPLQGAAERCLVIVFERILLSIEDRTESKRVEQGRDAVLEDVATDKYHEYK